MVYTLHRWKDCFYYVATNKQLVGLGLFVGRQVGRQVGSLNQKTQLTTMVTEGTGTQQRTVSCFHLSSIHPSIMVRWWGCWFTLFWPLPSSPLSTADLEMACWSWAGRHVLIWVCSPAGLNGDDNVESTDAYPNANSKGASLFLFVGWFF